MPLHDSDISWEVLRRIVRDWAGDRVELASVQTLEGGCVNTTLALSTRCGERAVLKITPHRVNRQFEREAQQLDLLREIGIAAPKVFAQKTATLDDPHSYLLMEFIDGIDLARAKCECGCEQFDALQAELADVVATMHDRTAAAYSKCDGGMEFASWPAFYRSIYDPIWAGVQKSECLPKRARKKIQKVHDRLETLLAHDDQPRLTHSDIWSTNLIARPDAEGRWHLAAVLDPNCRYAHAEAELAYMELFHTATSTFMKAYRRRHPIDDGYRTVRKSIYQLYPLMDHVAIFGEKYVKPMLATLEQIAC